MSLGECIIKRKLIKCVCEKLQLDNAKFNILLFGTFPVVFYIVEVYTGSVKYGGTDANVFISIFGELGDTGRRFLKNPMSSNINKFEKGQVG